MLFEINVKTKLSLLNVWLACSLLMLLTLFKVLNVLWTVGTWSLLVIMNVPWSTKWPNISSWACPIPISLRWALFCYFPLKIETKQINHNIHIIDLEVVLVCKNTSVCLAQINEKEMGYSSCCVDMNLIFICFHTQIWTCRVHTLLLEAKLRGSWSLPPPLHLVYWDKWISCNR